MYTGQQRTSFLFPFFSYGVSFSRFLFYHGSRSFRYSVFSLPPSPGKQVTTTLSRQLLLLMLIHCSPLASSAILRLHSPLLTFFLLYLHESGKIIHLSYHFSFSTPIKLGHLPLSLSLTGRRPLTRSLTFFSGILYLPA